MNTRKTVITKEYPETWEKCDELYYPINNEIYSKYKELAEKEEKIIFVGGLAEYRYYDMYNVIERALECVTKAFN